MNRVKTGLRALILILPLMIAVADWAWTQGASKIRVEGSFAEYYYSADSYDPSTGAWTGQVWADVYVAQGLGSGGKYDQLSFSIQQYTPDGYQYVSGNGPLPLGLVTVDKAGRSLSIQVDTGQLTDPWFYKEKSDAMEFPVIDLYWERTNEYWNRSEGHQVRQFGPWIFHWQGTSVRYSANVQGTITLPQIPGEILYEYVSPEIGWNRNVSMSITQGRPPK